MSLKISVIVPIYNVEKYLPKCIDSIINQTHKNLEIILVDDCSPDKCGEICDNYARQDERIGVIHKKENEGIAAARNTGLDLATGDLIGFVDSDDYINHKMYEILLDLMQDTEADISFCDCMRVQDGQMAKELTIRGEREILTNIEAVKGYFFERSLQTIVVWNKLYRKEIFTHFRFPLGEKIYEDAYVTYKLLYYSKKIAYTNDQLYYYVQRFGSVMRVFDEKSLQRLRAEKERTDFLREKEPQELYALSVCRYLKLIRFMYVDAKKAGFDPRILASLRKRFRKEYRYYKIPKHFSPFKWKFGVYLFYISPLLYKWALIIWKYCKRLKGISVKKILHRLKRFLQVIPTISHLFARFNAHEARHAERRIMLFCTCEYRNIGDHAIVEAENQFLADYFNEYFRINITDREYRYGKSIIKKCIRPSDILIIHGGGFLGTLWMGMENETRDIISAFPNNRIIVFPQTVFFEKTLLGLEELKKTRSIWQSHPELVVCLREKNSYEFVKSNLIGGKFKQCLLIPDIVLYLNKQRKTKRNGILMCFRMDKEKVLSDDKLKIIMDGMKKYGESIVHTDMVNDRPVLASGREKAVEDKLDEFRTSKLVVTDRLHAMIFAAITGTPCVALNNVSKKVEGVYEWINYLDYIKFAKTADEALEYADELMRSTGCPVYDNSQLLPYYDKLAEVVEGDI